MTAMSETLGYLVTKDTGGLCSEKWIDSHNVWHTDDPFADLFSDFSPLYENDEDDILLSPIRPSQENEPPPCPKATGMTPKVLFKTKGQPDRSVSMQQKPISNNVSLYPWH